MLAICSDLDETPDHETYMEIARFLNTESETRIGKGVGLEVGNTMYFDMQPGDYSFWNASDSERADLTALMRSGHIDCFHSFGDTAISRAHAQRALDYLQEHGCKLRVWIDHAVAPTNLGADIMQGYGDVPGADAYHADLTVAHGVEYVWRGRVTSVIGQGVERRLGRILDMGSPVKSGITLAKEFVKGIKGRTAGHQYAPHYHNRVLWADETRDGQQVFEFLRSNPHPHGVSVGDRGERIGEVLTDRMLDALVERGGTSIVYTHLGKSFGHESIFPPATVNAFQNLAQRQATGDVLVTTTSRLLDYHRLLDALSWRVESGDSQLDIFVDSDQPIDGLSFNVNHATNIRVIHNGSLVESAEVRHSRDGNGTQVVVPWARLEFPL
jgi:hypothetical protein